MIKEKETILIALKALKNKYEFLANNSELKESLTTLENIECNTAINHIDQVIESIESDKVILKLGQANELERRVIMKLYNLANTYFIYVCISIGIPLVVGLFLTFYTNKYIFLGNIFMLFGSFLGIVYGVIVLIRHYVKR